MLHPGCCWGCAFTLTKPRGKRLWGGWDVPQLSPRCPSLLPCSPRDPPGVARLPPAAHAEHPPASSRPGCCRRALPDTLPPSAPLLFLLPPSSPLSPRGLLPGRDLSCCSPAACQRLPARRRAHLLLPPRRSEAEPPASSHGEASPRNQKRESRARRVYKPRGRL